jgi:hypothetical protein
MSHKVIETVLSAALAASGTLTLSYPIGTNPGTFVGGKRHKVVTGAGDKFDSPKYFTLSYGASNITLTWGSSSPTLPVDTKLFIQLDIAGSSSQSTVESANPPLSNAKAAAMKVIEWGAPLAAVSNGVSSSQSVSGSAAALLNGSLLSTIVNGRMIFDVPRNVVGAWTNAAVVTITGRDDYGRVMVEQSASGTSHTGKKAFKEITSIVPSTSITGATFGTGNVLGLPVYVPSVANVLAEFENGVNMKPAGRVLLPVPINQTDLLAPTVQDIVSPVDGYIDTVRTMVQVAVTTGGTLTAKVNGNTVTGCVVTIANAATKGTAGSASPTTRRDSSTVVAKGDRIGLTPASFASAGAVNAEIEVEVSGLQGTLVTGLTTAATATSNDVRGTYAPRTVPDGATRYALLVQLVDPDFLGQTPYSG